MIHNLLHEDKELKRVAHTPKDQKPRFEWSAVLQSLAMDKEREVREAVLRVMMQAPKGDSPDSP